MQEGLAKAFHHPGYEYFVSTDAPQHAAHGKLKIMPLRAWVTIVDEQISSDVSTQSLRDVRYCPRHACNPQAPSHLRFGRKIAGCHEPVLAEEARRVSLDRSFRYAFVMRIRPDHLWLRRVPHVRSLFDAPDRSLPASPPGQVLLWDDQAAAARRDMIAAVLLAPKSVFATCASAKQWSHACSGTTNTPVDMRSCQKQDLAPCEPMSLILTLDGGERITISRLPWQQRQWNRSQYEPTNSGDFCIKRHRFLRNDPDNDCRNNDGCMDC